MLRVIINLLLAGTLCSLSASAQRMMPFSFWKAPTEEKKEQRYERPKHLSDAEISSRNADGVHIIAAYPNPFGEGSLSGDESTMLDLEISRDGRIEVGIFTLLGSRIQKLIIQDLKRGRHQLKLTGISVPGGMYLLGVSSGSNVSWLRVIVIR